MRKRILALLACGAIAATSMVGLAGCGDDDKGKTTLKLWGPDAQQTTLKDMAAKFVEANPDLNVKVEVGVCSEKDAYGEVSKDPSAAADVFAFANDQLANFIRIGALAEIRNEYRTKVEADNIASTVNLGMFNGKLYGYPYAADNSYVMFYDSSVVTEADAATLEGVIAACEAGTKKIAWKLGDGWYDAAWFFAAGGMYSVSYNEDYSENEVICNFNDAGIGDKATAAMRVLASSSAFIGAATDVDSVISRVGDDIAVAITGSWNLGAIRDNLGENFAVTKLPTVKIDGKDTQLKPFLGGKLYGVNSHAGDKLVAAHKLAQFLSSKEMQEIRFDKHQIGPSNKDVAAMEKIKTDAFVQALALQAPHSVAQVSVPANFWDPVAAYATWAAGSDYNAAEMQGKLDAMRELIVPKAELNYIYLVGTINGWNKDENPRVDAQKFTTTDPDKNVWTIEYTFTDDDKNENGKIEVKGVLVDTKGNASWPEGNTPNAVIDEAGTYILTFTVDDGLTKFEKK